MPLKLIPPRPGKTPYYYVRGTHLGVSVNRSTGLGDKRKAQQALWQIRDEIERGALSGTGPLTFADAALSYMRAGGERRFLEPILRHFGDRPLSALSQAAVDAAADILYPTATPATRNRQVYTPIVALIRHAGMTLPIRRPKGAQGFARQEWLEPSQASILLAAAPDQRFRALVTFLLYTGCRLSEALELRWETIDLQRSAALIPKTKTGVQRALHLTPDVVAEIAALPDGRAGLVFGLRKGAGLYKPWRKMTAAVGMPWVTPHVLRHTYATWLRIYTGADLKALIDTGAWADLKSVARYTHAVPSEAAKRADLLPTVEKLRTSKANN